MNKFNVWVSYNLHSSYGTGAATLEEAVSKAKWARDYYEPMYPGTVQVSISMSCDRCEGNGCIAKGRKNVRFPKYVDCPTCKGDAAFQVPAVA